MIVLYPTSDPNSQHCKFLTFSVLAWKSEALSVVASVSVKYFAARFCHLVLLISRLPVFTTLAQLNMGPEAYAPIFSEKNYWKKYGKTG